MQIHGETSSKSSSMRPGVKVVAALRTRTCVVIISADAHLRTVTMSSLKPYLILSPREARPFKRAYEISAAAEIKFHVTRRRGSPWIERPLDDRAFRLGPACRRESTIHVSARLARSAERGAGLRGPVVGPRGLDVRSGPLRLATILPWRAGCTAATGVTRSQSDIAVRRSGIDQVPMMPPV